MDTRTKKELIAYLERCNEAHVADHFIIPRRARHFIIDLENESSEIKLEDVENAIVFGLIEAFGSAGSWGREEIKKLAAATKKHLEAAQNTRERAAHTGKE